MFKWKAYLRFILIVPALATSQSPDQAGDQVAKSTKAPNEVQAIVGQAKAAALEIKNEYARGVVLGSIGEAEAKSGDLDAASETAVRAYPHTSSLLLSLGEQLGHSGDMARARSIARKLRGGSSSTLFAGYARQQAKEGKIEEALQTAKEIQAPEVRSQVLEAIAEQIARKGDFKYALKTLADARAAYPQERSTIKYDEVVIAEAQFAHGEMRPARVTIDSIKIPETRTAMLLQGAEELIKKGNKGDALEWFGAAFQPPPARAVFRHPPILGYSAAGQARIKVARLGGSILVASSSWSKGLRSHSNNLCRG